MEHLALQKKVDCSFWVGSELLPQVKELTYIRVLFASESKMERCQADQCIISNTIIVLECGVEERGEPEALNLTVLTIVSYLWS